ncbi:hypothetical protein N5B56_01380 [Eubacterium sp. LFL-14]|uniref:Transposase n=1 Tax=Eubacterium album TaxID=2978477 RepID=A0ABT2LWR4_9FIRM|nr:hypothetical protein [Eubacterium sp. LFL-14]MCT7397737.1 hypothetical protein [Eubacterium sp. LFL-14]
MCKKEKSTMEEKSQSLIPLKAKLWIVMGINDMEGMIYAFCTTRQKAEKAVKLLEPEGLDNMLTIKQAQLEINNVCLNGTNIEI